MTAPDYHSLVEHYTACFHAHGATPQGVDWPSAQDAQLRHRVMLGVAHALPCSLLDLGCGYGALKEYINARALPVDYRGVDLSAPLLAAARAAHPDTSFELRDVLTDPLPPQSVDYVVMNGVLTEKRALSFEAMEGFAHAIIRAAFSAARVGIAFNVMRAQVDWQRDDLFHLPYDRLAAFLTGEISRHFTLRADYGLYEYTAYVYRTA